MAKYAKIMFMINITIKSATQNNTGMYTKEIAQQTVQNILKIYNLGEISDGLSEWNIERMKYCLSTWIVELCDGLPLTLGWTLYM